MKSSFVFIAALCILTPTEVDALKPEQEQGQNQPGKIKRLFKYLGDKKQQAKYYVVKKLGAAHTWANPDVAEEKSLTKSAVARTLRIPEANKELGEKYRLFRWGRDALEIFAGATIGQYGADVVNALAPDPTKEELAKDSKYELFDNTQDVHTDDPFYFAREQPEFKPRKSLIGSNFLRGTDTSTGGVGQHKQSSTGTRDQTEAHLNPRHQTEAHSLFYDSVRDHQSGVRQSQWSASQNHNTRTSINEGGERYGDQVYQSIASDK